MKLFFVSSFQAFDLNNLYAKSKDKKATPAEDKKTK